MNHDLDQQIAYTRTGLEQEKKPIGFLIGAGASMAIQIGGVPLIPALADLTARVRAELGEPYSSALDSLIADLPEDEQNNLESVLNYVRTLGSLPGSTPIRGVEKAVFAALDIEICRVVRSQVDKELPYGDSPFRSLALWISAARRSNAVQIFTTNYDLLLEQALERTSVTYFDGFMGSREPKFDIQAIEEDALPERWTLLWKLHGSINWSRSHDGVVRRRTPDSSDQDSALIYPSHLKYDQSRRLPYLAMMDRLREYMRKPGAILLTAGFSFRDQHINEMLDQSLRSNPTANLQAFLYGDLEMYPEAIALAETTPNLVILASDEGIVGTVRGKWAPIVNAETGDATARTNDLGDFVRMGELLRSLIGDLSRSDADREV